MPRDAHRRVRCNASQGPKISVTDPGQAPKSKESNVIFDNACELKNEQKCATVTAPGQARRVGRSKRLKPATSNTGGKFYHRRRAEEKKNTIITHVGNACICDLMVSVPKVGSNGNFANTSASKVLPLCKCPFALREGKAIVILLMLAILKRTKMFIRYCTGAGTGGIRR